MKELIGEPYERNGQNCRWACVQALRLMEMDEAADSLDVMTEIADAHENWDRCRGDKTRPGDVVLTIPDQGALHIGVVVPDGRILTSSENLGVYTLPIERVSGIIARYRYRG